MGKGRKKGKREEGRWGKWKKDDWEKGIRKKEDRGKGRRTMGKREKGEKGHESQPEGSGRLCRSFSRLC